MERQIRTWISSGKYSVWSWFILSLVVIFSRFLLPRFQTFDVLSILSWDVFGYYLYLPATFIYHDLGLQDFGWVQHLLDTYHPTNGFYQAYVGPTGDYVMKYPMGPAILYAPFFFLAHVIALMSGFPADGLSLPYQVTISMGCLGFTVIGLWFLRKILLVFFGDKTVAVTLVMLVLGTNYFQLTAYDGALVHNALFTLYTLIIWCTIRWHQKPTWSATLWLGFLLGLIIITRPTEIIALLIPLLWGMYDNQSAREKWRLIAGHWPMVIVAAGVFLATGFLQMVYWKMYAGQWLYYSYESTEKLEWVAPWLWQVLFSFKKGWLIYTPLMILALMGFYRLGNRYKPVFFALFFFALVNILIVASWPTWWYGGSFGQRAMMQSYAILAFPLAAIAEWILNRKIWVKTLVFIVISGFILLNLFQTWQYMNWIIDPSLMTKEYYWRIFGKLKTDNVSKTYLEGYREMGWEALGQEDDYHRTLLVDRTFEHPDDWIAGGLPEDSMVHSGSFSCILNPDMGFYSLADMPLSTVIEPATDWIRVTCWFFSLSPYQINPGNFVITMNHQGKWYKYRKLSLENESLIPGKWQKLVYTYQIPYTNDTADRLQIFLQRNSMQSLYIDTITLEQFEPK